MEGGVFCPQPRNQRVGAQWWRIQAHEPRLELRARERSATHLRFALDQLRRRRSLHALPQRLTSTPYLPNVFGKHPQYRYLNSGSLWISVESERRLERRARELVGADRPGEATLAPALDPPPPPHPTPPPPPPHPLS